MFKCAFESVFGPAFPLRVWVQFDFQALKRQRGLFLHVTRCYSPQNKSVDNVNSRHQQYPALEFRAGCTFSTSRRK